MKTNGPVRGGPIAFLLLVNVLYFFPVLAKGNQAVLSSAGTDTWLCFFYWRNFAYESLARGEIPLWNPYVFSGTPFVAGIQSAIFYPLNLVFLVFSTPLAINISIALHCFLASVFTTCYARTIGVSQSGSLLSGISFAYGAPFFLHILPGHLAPLSAMIWLPLLFLGVEAFARTADIRFVLLSGIVLALQVLAGHPQYLFYSVLAVSVSFCARLWSLKRLRIARALGGYLLFILTGRCFRRCSFCPRLNSRETHSEKISPANGLRFFLCLPKNF